MPCAMAPLKALKQCNKMVTVVELLELMMQGADLMWLVWHTWATQGSIVRGDSGGAIVVRLPFRHICFKGPPD